MAPTLKHINPKRPCWWLAVLLISGMVLLSCHDSDGGAQTDLDFQDEHDMGSVWAMVYPTNLALRLADHTYISAIDTNGNTYDWLCFGKDADGEDLENTLTEGNADLTTIGFMASEPPCKWPLEYYLRIGVCHQCANRALYHTGKTVAASEGYDFFLSIYGTYGDASISESHTYSMENCLDASPPWKGGPSSSALQKMAGEADREYPIGKESQLYRKYFQNNTPHALNQNQGDLYAGYLDELFLMRIQKKMGEDFSTLTADQLVGIRNQYREYKSILDRETMQSRVSEIEMVTKYEKLFNDLADEYRSILTPLEFETLFDLDYTKAIELDDILPR